MWGRREEGEKKKVKRKRNQSLLIAGQATYGKQRRRSQSTGSVGVVEVESLEW